MCPSIGKILSNRIFNLVIVPTFHHIYCGCWQFHYPKRYARSALGILQTEYIIFLRGDQQSMFGRDDNPHSHTFLHKNIEKVSPHSQEIWTPHCSKQCGYEDHHFFWNFLANTLHKKCHAQSDLSIYICVWSCFRFSVTNRSNGVWRLSTSNLKAKRTVFEQTVRESLNFKILWNFWKNFICKSWWLPTFFNDTWI